MSTQTMRLSILILATSLVLPVLGQTPEIEQGRSALSRGDIGAAIDILEKAVAQTPQNAKAHLYLATAYSTAAQGGMMAAIKYGAKVKSEFEATLALDPKNVEARFGLVQIYATAPAAMGGSDDKAFQLAKEIKAIDPVFGHRAYAFVFLQQKRSDLAKLEYLESIREQPKSARAHTQFGLFLVNTEKDYPLAFSEFETALKIDASYMPAFYHLGRSSALAKTNFGRGEEAAKKYVAYMPQENEPALANAHYYLGMIYEQLGKKEQAKLSYETALKLKPSLADASEALKRVM